MTLREMCIRSYQNSEQKKKADYNAFELAGYYLTQRPGVEVIHLKKEIAANDVQESVGYAVLRLLEEHLQEVNDV